MASESQIYSLEQYREIFRKINLIVLLHDKEGNILEANEKMLLSLGYDESQISRLSIYDVLEPSGQKGYEVFIENTLCDAASTSEFIIKKRSGGSIPVNVSSNLVKIDGKEIIVCVMDEITKLKRAEQELREKNNFIDSIIENIPNMIFVKDAQELRFVRFNQAGEDLLGLPRDQMLGKNDYDLFPEKEADFFTYKDRAVLKSGELMDISEEEIHTKFRGIRTLHTKKITINDEYGTPKYLLGISEDITEQKKGQDILKKNEEYYRSLVENSHDLIIETDHSGNFLYVSPNHRTILGYEPRELMGKSIFENVHPEDKTEVIAEFSRALMTQSYGHGIFRYRHKNGEWRWFETNGRPIQAPSGPVRIVLHSRDITERFESEEEIRRSLREKESLLREIHHRVKNNLQVISSLLSLQSDYVTDKDTLRLFQESQSRIYTIALIHEQLYQSKDLGQIDIRNYIKDLTDNLKSVYGDEGSAAVVEVDSQDIAVNIDTAIPCGLIINELFSNSFKHAFRNCKGSHAINNVENLISVAFQSDQENGFVLSVKDNGKGLPPGLDYRNTETLGLQLVSTLTDQLKGKMEVEGGEGCAIRITFPSS